jgi:hypothetical protein
MPPVQLERPDLVAVVAAVLTNELIEPADDQIGLGPQKMRKIAEPVCPVGVLLLDPVEIPRRGTVDGPLNLGNAASQVLCGCPTAFTVVVSL